MANNIMHAVLVQNVSSKCIVTWLLLHIYICTGLVSFSGGSCYCRTQSVVFSCENVTITVVLCADDTCLLCINLSSAKVNVNHVGQEKKL